MDLPGAQAKRDLSTQAKKDSLLAESPLALLRSDVVPVDGADFRSRWALVQVLHELVQRALFTLSLAGDL